MGMLDGKVAWVTGAGSGIGEAAAVALAGEGAYVVLTGRRREPLEAVAARLGGVARVAPADMAVAADVDGVVAGIEREFGRLDILSANAGLNVRERRWDQVSAAGLAEVIAANLNSAFYGARAVLPIMRRQRDGVLIHTASIAGRYVGLMSGPAYTAAKHGVVAMSHSINMEECVHGIRSSVVNPGEVATPILDRRPVPVTKEERARMVQPEDVGDLIRYIACLPPHVVMNEVMIAPTWNRGYVAALERSDR